MKMKPWGQNYEQCKYITYKGLSEKSEFKIRLPQHMIKWHIYSWTVTIDTRSFPLLFTHFFCICFRIIILLRSKKTVSHRTVDSRFNFNMSLSFKKDYSLVNTVTIMWMIFVFLCAYCITIKVPIILHHCLLNYLTTIVMSNTFKSVDFYRV